MVRALESPSIDPKTTCSAGSGPAGEPDAVVVVVSTGEEVKVSRRMALEAKLKEKLNEAVASGKPVEGKKEFKHEWMGAKWYFATAANRDLFKADPDKYAPRYGGYCAYAVAMGKTADIDPNAWKIVDGKLYLNYDKGSAAELEQSPGELAKAKTNWPKIKAKLIP